MEHKGKKECGRIVRQEALHAARNCQIGFPVSPCCVGLGVWWWCSSRCLSCCSIFTLFLWVSLVTIKLVSRAEPFIIPLYISRTTK